LAEVLYFTCMQQQGISREDRLELYKKVIAAVPDAVCKGDSIPYTSLNGHMYSYFSKDGFIALRLPVAARIPFLEKHSTTLVTAYGIVQKEYVVVPDSLLLVTDELKPWFDQSFAYVSSLKPKPSRGKTKD
jgi:hypothetical protein